MSAQHRPVYAELLTVGLRVPVMWLGGLRREGRPWTPRLLRNGAVLFRMLRN
jgi:hypothetical protein